MKVTNLKWTWARKEVLLPPPQYANAGRSKFEVRGLINTPPIPLTSDTLPATSPSASQYHHVSLCGRPRHSSSG
jgi:hypothetical protein